MAEHSDIEEKLAEIRNLKTNSAFQGTVHGRGYFGYFENHASAEQLPEAPQSVEGGQIEFAVWPDGAEVAGWSAPLDSLATDEAALLRRYLRNVRDFCATIVEGEPTPSRNDDSLVLSHRLGALPRRPSDRAARVVGFGIGHGSPIPSVALDGTELVGQVGFIVRSHGAVMSGYTDRQATTTGAGATISEFLAEVIRCCWSSLAELG